MKTRLSRLKEAADLAWASAIDAPADKRGPLLAQFRALLAEIDELSQTKMKAGDPVDEVAQRRSARRAGSASGEGRARRTR